MTTLLLEPLRAVARGTVLKRDLCYAVTRHRDRIGLAKISFTRFTKENHCIHAACDVECLLSCVRHITHIAGWSSLVARQAHNLKVLGSNPNPATIFGAFLETERPLFIAFYAILAFFLHLGDSLKSRETLCVCARFVHGK
jgi:hypothetical protein